MFLRAAVFFILIASCALYGEPAYQVVLDDVDPSIHSAFDEYSTLVKQQELPVKSDAQLEWRAQDDLNLLKRLYQEKGYLSPTLDLSIDHVGSVPVVRLRGAPGELYLLKEVEVQTAENTFVLDGKDLGETATLDRILYIEEEFIEQLRRGGYPFVELKNRKIIALKGEQSVKVILEINLGPKATFAKTVVAGNSAVHTKLILRKIDWKEGDVYDADAVERTVAALEKTGLFTHITIKPASTSCDEVPMIIEVAEAKHRTIGAGVGFTSQLGPGVNLEWENRNFRGRGETLSFKTHLWQRLQNASVLYLKPDVFSDGQNLIWKGEVQREVTEGFTEESWGLSALLERQISPRTEFSYGLAFKQIHDTRSDNNRLFTLLKTPLKLYYHKTDSLMDPTKGKTALVKVTPTMQILSPQFAYCITELTATKYIPLSDFCVLAGKLSLGSIWGSSRKGIPPSERFYAGTESMLRGYKYMTVSPLNHEHKPIGGRSLVVGSLELRTRVYEDISLVTFYEAGNVYSAPFPDFREKILHSVGAGIRYHTPVGPLRLDVGIPLNKRRHVDNSYEIYFSIGQSF